MARCCRPLHAPGPMTSVTPESLYHLQDRLPHSLVSLVYWQHTLGPLTSFGLWFQNNVVITAMAKSHYYSNWPQQLCLKNSGTARTHAKHQL